MSDDVVRPRGGVAQAIYDAFRAEAKKRDGRPHSAWVEAERYAVWSAARDEAQKIGAQVPTMEQIVREDNFAMGHSDYGAKWARGVALLIEQSDT